MPDQKTFPPYKEGRFYLSEGGTETEILYKYGFDQILCSIIQRL